MRRLSTGILLGFTAFLAACGSVYRVDAFKSDKPSGIPFYSSIGVCTQQTVYANPYYLVSLKVTGTSGVLFSGSTKVSNGGHQSNDFQNLINELSKPQPEVTSVEKAWELLKQHQPFDPYTQTDGEFVLSNSAKASTVVDYGHAYSLNQRKPLTGSASADYKLNSDGTLGEVQGQVQDTTLSTILAALPLSNLIESAAGIATKAGSAEATKTETVQFSLEQEERVITKTYSKTTAYAANCPTGTPLTGSSSGISTALADVGAGGSSANTGATKDASSIGITATVTLPKALLPQSNPSAAQDGNTPTQGKSGSPPPKKNPTGNPSDKQGSSTSPGTQ